MDLCVPARRRAAPLALGMALASATVFAVPATPAPATVPTDATAAQRPAAEPPRDELPYARERARERQVESADSVAEVLRTIEPEAGRRLRHRFAEHGVAYPPERVDLLAFKRESRLEVRAWRGGRAELAAVYPLRAASGGYGPKLREGDEQIPEGIYRVTLLNPNSDFHLSMKVDYPNDFDRARAAEDGRTNLGGDIFIHGDSVSAGCLAVGNAEIEELFVLAAEVGVENLRVIIAPWDFRRDAPPVPPVAARLGPDWLPRLYAEIRKALASG